MYLLDTNIVSELRKQRPHGAVVSWIQSVPNSNLYLSAVTLGEIQSGIEITREQDPTKANIIEIWADQVSSSYNILPMDAITFRRWAKLMHRQSDTVYEDAMIAAIAITHQLTVVTRNVKDFKRFKVPLLNPFTYETKTLV
jgi:predicted nucleic acid-binding protein